jgi:putative phosphoribosyl transferase
VAAIPVAPRENVSSLRKRVNDLVILATPEPFIAVGHHYHSFTQVDDAQVLDYLNAAKQSRAA